MKNVIRLGVIVALAMGASGARADHDPYTANAPHPQADPAASIDPSPPGADAVQVEATSGAGGMEPRQETDEKAGAATHQAWVESIWTSP